MNKLDNIKLNISKMAGRKGLELAKRSPEIFVALGLVAIVGGTVLACRATLKAKDFIDESKEDVETIKYVRETKSEEEYSDKDYKKDLAVAYVQRGVGVAKLYGPAILVGTVGIGLVLKSHNILQERNVAMIAAYKAIEKSFLNYRSRVIEEFGEEKDSDYRRGVHRRETVGVVEDENGKKKKVKESYAVVDAEGVSQYARFFDESCPEWDKTAEYNLFFLRAQQNIANDLLRSRGHLFLNEVYDMLGIPKSNEGQVVGWLLGKGGDDYVDFGIYDTTVAGYKNDHAWETIGQERLEFVNGYRNTILLDFNVDGIIWGMI